MTTHSQTTSNLSSTIQRVSLRHIRRIAAVPVFCALMGAAQSVTALEAPADLPQGASALVQNNGILQGTLDQVSQTRLEARLEQLQSFGTRHVNSSYITPGQGIGAARDYIHAQFANIALNNPTSEFQAELDSFPVSWYGINSTASNVVGIQPGTDPNAGVIVIGAHYDSTTTSWGDGLTAAPGANDNGSGIVALLEMAEIIGSRSAKPRATVIFVAFTAEEIGRLGSIHFANVYLPAHNLTPTLMINMDIIGSSTGPNGQINDTQIRLFSAGPDDSPSRQMARTLQMINHAYPTSLEIVLQDAVDRPGRYGDHMSFNEAGYPAVRFIEPLEETDHQHNAADTTSDIQYPYLQRATQTVLESVIVLADGPAGPDNLIVGVGADNLPVASWDATPGATRYVIALRTPGSLTYDEQFEVETNSLVWEGFVPVRYAAFAVAAKDANGLTGPLSEEFVLS